MSQFYERTCQIACSRRRRSRSGLLRHEACEPLVGGREAELGCAGGEVAVARRRHQAQRAGTLTGSAMNVDRPGGGLDGGAQVAHMLLAELGDRHRQVAVGEAHFQRREAFGLGGERLALLAGCTQVDDRDESLSAQVVQFLDRGLAADGDLVGQSGAVWTWRPPWLVARSRLSVMAG